MIKLQYAEKIGNRCIFLCPKCCYCRFKYFWRFCRETDPSKVKPITLFLWIDGYGISIPFVLLFWWAWRLKSHYYRSYIHVTITSLILRAQRVSVRKKNIRTYFGTVPERSRQSSPWTCKQQFVVAIYFIVKVDQPLDGRPSCYHCNICLTPHWLGILGLRPYTFGEWNEAIGAINEKTRSKRIVSMKRGDF